MRRIYGCYDRPTKRHRLESGLDEPDEAEPGIQPGQGLRLYLEQSGECPSVLEYVPEGAEQDPENHLGDGYH